MSEYIGWLDEDHAPVVDMAQEVVRCRDCTYYATDELGDYCTLLDFEDAQGMEDRFCSWGERSRTDREGVRE